MRMLTEESGEKPHNAHRGGIHNVPQLGVGGHSGAQLREGSPHESGSEVHGVVAGVMHA